MAWDSGQRTNPLTTPRIAARQFLDWWGASLAAAWPGVIGDHRHKGPGAMASRVDGAVRLDFDAAVGPNAALVVTLDPALALVNRRRYPFDVVGSLADLLRAEIDRLTPFTSEEACLSFQVSAYDWNRREIEVAFAVVRRSLLSELRDEVEAAGHRLMGYRIATAGGDLAIAAGEPDAVVATAPRARPGRIVWAVVTVALLAAVVITPALRMRQIADDEQAQVESLRAQAEAGASALGDVRFIEENMAMLESRRDAATSKLSILNELSRIVPQDSWLLSIEIRDNRIRMTGVSPAPAAVVTALAASPLLSDIQYRSAGVRNESLNGERFELSAQLSLREEERS